MPKTLPTLEEFLAALPADRRDTMTTLHKAILAHMVTHGVLFTASRLGAYF